MKNARSFTATSSGQTEVQLEHPTPDEFERDLDPLVSSLLDDPLTWIVRPLLRGLTAGKYAAVRSHAFPRFRTRVSLLRRRGTIRIVDGVAYCWESENQRRAFGGLLNSHRAVAPSGLIALTSTRAAFSRSAKRTIANLDEALERSPWPSVHGVELERLVRVAATQLADSRRTLARHKTRRVVVAATDSIRARALVFAAREAAVPSVYLPHAPTARNRHYRDLPTDYAALRGPRDVAHYVSLGADEGKVSAVGALAYDERIARAPPSSRRAVVAPSGWDTHTLGMFLNRVDLAIHGPYDILPHPRNDLGVVRGATERGRVVSGRKTWEHLLNGASVVVQAGSGVALEALLLGIPVIDVRLRPGRPAHYHMLREPEVTVADFAELPAAIHHAARSAEQLRDARVRWAQQWCCAVGSEAAAAFGAFLESATESSVPLVDGWMKAPR